MQPQSRGRRRFLHDLGASTILAAAGGAGLLRQSAGATQHTLRWPISIGSPVLDSLRPAIENSRDVHTNIDKIIEVAGWMAYEDLPLPDFALPFEIGKDPGQAIDFILVANVMAARAGEMVHEPALAIRTGIFTGCLARAVVARPSWSLAVCNATTSSLRDRQPRAPVPAA